MKKIFLFIFILFGSCCKPKEYKVKLIFCDNRPPIIITVNSCSKPDNTDIHVDNRSVSEFYMGCGCNGQKYLNVCEVQVLDDNYTEPKDTISNDKKYTY